MNRSIAALSLAALAGCIGGETSQLIGPEGGKIEVGGAAFVFPPGTFSTPQTVIAKADSEWTPPEEAPRSLMFELGPETLTFAQPVSVTLPTVYSAAHELRWSRVNGDVTTWERIPSTFTEFSVSTDVTRPGKGFAGPPRDIDLRIQQGGATFRSAPNSSCGYLVGPDSWYDGSGPVPVPENALLFRCATLQIGGGMDPVELYLLISNLSAVVSAFERGEGVHSFGGGDAAFAITLSQAGEQKRYLAESGTWALEFFKERHHDYVLEQYTTHLLRLRLTDVVMRTSTGATISVNVLFQFGNLM